MPRLSLIQKRARKSVIPIEKLLTKKVNKEHIEKSRTDLGVKKYPDQGQGFFN